jgi:hypothetical protein
MLMDTLDFVCVDVDFICVYGFLLIVECIEKWFLKKRQEYLCIEIKYYENSLEESTH